jgi:hypothetical protein
MSPSRTELKLLTRQGVSDDQWTVLRDTPYLVALAVSEADGSRLDTLLERGAGAKAIADGINNDHPLIRAIGDRPEVDRVIQAMHGRFADVGGRPKFSPAEIKDIAVQSAQRAFAILDETGSDLDLYAYRTFVMNVLRAVAEAAREGDLLGIGGTLVSDAERTVISAVTAALHPSK